MTTHVETIDEPVRQQQPSSRWPKPVAALISFLTFPLIFVGGLVTTTDAGMAVPDWPTTYGYNMFLYPWYTWFFGPWDVFIEHGHRMLGALVGLATIALVIIVFRKDDRPWMRKLVVIALLAVVAQGMLGGLRVTQNNVQLAMVHGCFGQLFFALTAVILTTFSRFWGNPVAECQAEAETVRSQLAKPLRLALITTVLVYLQVVLGALIRHIPVTASTQTFSTLVIFHVAMALVVIGHIVAIALSLRKRKALAPAVGRYGKWLTCLVLLQVGLGLGTWVLKYGFPMGLGENRFFANHLVTTYGWWQEHITTAHVAIGALLFTNCVLLTTRLFRLRFEVGVEKVRVEADTT